MAIISDGVMKKSPQIIWQGTTSTPWPDDILGRLSSYDELYSRQLWVSVLVNKIANATARLPFKVYERTADGRQDARNSPLGRLLQRPSTRLDPFAFWVWTQSTLDIHGEAFWGKLRDRGGRPIELVPIHPSNIRRETIDGSLVWSYTGTSERRVIERRDLVHFQHFNPSSLVQGLSPLEPLRSTLENEDGARRANSALWRNGGRPSVYLTHPQQLSDDAGRRLAAQWADLHGGVDNWAKAAVLEEGMEAKTVALNVEELQYIESRKLNREEVCAIYDVPPPAVHILDRATYSNITEQNRSMYRDTMAPKLGLLESTVEFELRDGSFGQGPPDFGEEFYAEFLMDEVLRGDFENRTKAQATAVQFGLLTPAEVRQQENRPFIEGSDRLMVNSTMVPLDSVAAAGSAEGEQHLDVLDLALALQKLYLSVGTVITAEEARSILNRAGAGLDGLPPAAAPQGRDAAPMLEAGPDPAGVRSVLGRTSRAKTLFDLDPQAWRGLLDPSTEIAVLGALTESKAAGESVEQFRTRLGAITRR